jgi:hypothetical protein
MARALYLTAEEKKLFFNKLPDAIRKSWELSLKEETIDAYETAQELEKRGEEVARDPDAAQPEFARMLNAHLESGKGLDDVPIADIPPNILYDGFYQMGASGLSAFIQLSLQDADIEDQDMIGIATLTLVRHHVLEANAKIA